MAKSHDRSRFTHLHGNNQTHSARKTTNKNTKPKRTNQTKMMIGLPNNTQDEWQRENNNSLPTLHVHRTGVGVSVSLCELVLRSFAVRSVVVELSMANSRWRSFAFFRDAHDPR